MKRRTRETRNEICYVLRNMCETMSTTITTGSFVSAFFIYIGLGAQDISIINFAANMGLIAASILVLLFENRDHSGLGMIRIGSLGNILLPLAMLLAGFMGTGKHKWMLVMLVLLHFVGNTAYSMRNSAEINAVPILFGRARYAAVMGKCGIYGGILVLLVNVVSFITQTENDGFSYFRVIYGISVLLMIIYFVLSMAYRQPENREKEDQPDIRISMLFQKKYLREAIPHLVRGVGAAFLALWPAAVMSQFTVTAWDSSVLVFLTIIAEIIGSLCFLPVSKRIRPGTMTMIGFLISAVLMILTPFISSMQIYFVCIFVNGFASKAFTRGLMAAFVHHCDEEELAMVSSFHVLYYAIAYAPSVLIAGMLITRYRIPCLIFGGIVYGISGIMFHFYYYQSLEERRKFGDGKKGNYNGRKQWNWKGHCKRTGTEWV